MSLEQIFGEFLPQANDRRAAVLGLDHLVAGADQDLACRSAEVGIVVDHENAGHGGQRSAIFRTSAISVFDSTGFRSTGRALAFRNAATSSCPAKPVMKITRFAISG